MVRVPIHPHLLASNSLVLNGRDTDNSAHTIPAGYDRHVLSTPMAGFTGLVGLLSVRAEPEKCLWK